MQAHGSTKFGAVGVMLSMMGGLGCAGSMTVTRTYTPEAATRVQSETFVPGAVVRGTDRVTLPAGARVEDQHIILPKTYTHHLAPGDVVEQDENGLVVGVRKAGNPPVEIHFVPGTGVSYDSDIVRGELADEDAAVPLEPSDGIEMHGNLEPDASIPGGGHVESQRATAALADGLVLFGLSYLSSVWVVTESKNPADRSLSIPVAGPWMDLSQRAQCVAPKLPTPPPIDPCMFETVARIALVVSGSAQGLGTLLTLIGLPTHSVVVEGPTQGSGGAESSRPRVVFAPLPNGAGVVGSF